MEKRFGSIKTFIITNTKTQKDMGSKVFNVLLQNYLYLYRLLAGWCFVLCAKFTQYF